MTAGASATGRTDTASCSEVVAVTPSVSVLVAETVSTKSSSLLSGGVIVSEPKSHPVTSTAVSVVVATKVLTPSLSVAPAGIAEISVVRLSLPSVSTSALLRMRSMAVSSLPLAG